MDKSALGWEHVEKVEKHESQKGNYQTGHESYWIGVFKFFIYINSITCVVFLSLIHSDYKSGFGGSFGVQNDRQDKSAVGWEHIEKVEKHESQKGSTWYKYA